MSSKVSLPNTPHRPCISTWGGLCICSNIPFPNGRRFKLLVTILLSHAFLATFLHGPSAVPSPLNDMRNTWKSAQQNGCERSISLSLPLDFKKGFCSPNEFLLCASSISTPVPTPTGVTSNRLLLCFPQSLRVLMGKVTLAQIERVLMNSLSSLLT